MSSRSSTKILVVDDALFMRTILKDILQSNGFTNILEAGDGAAAIDAYRKNKPDLVTMDINMPGTDGIQALKSIISIDPTAKIIMVTSVEQKQIMQEAIKVGAKDYVVKPFDRAMVAAVLNKVMRGR
ncbi:response regulator containing CheY-like receiver domain and AraC-type DNA-binding domain [Candidatus Nitrososphaera evergladensis SR1]|jgi:two-component system chemotaxis response regulator CheY|uniref:Response regulator containing CheY-like receiver domain and AraC-type DNA-binding domain n=1 Tax=Candidatus Nitrososphaera evergladensis SR1 TaxID=1459636 RepID=A0A075MTG1_9ARCH|nr:response regulator [Candidatus Nitrososphaera evergladensis]AIF84398.1 response regulator containing CheY-like receiver domain and AraC-type DNA-binding domain [Candidatus Nitrososphaera evergladensis SR1]